MARTKQKGSPSSMLRRVQNALGKLPKSLKSRIRRIELIFVDEDFGSAEILLDPMEDLTEEEFETLHTSVVERLVRVPGLREVRFLQEDPSSPPAEETAPEKVHAGLSLALDMLRSLEGAIERDLSHRALRQMRRMQRFKTSPCKEWIREAEERARALPSGSSSTQKLMPQLKEIFKRLSRAARQISRLIESEKVMWQIPEKGARKDAMEAASPEIVRSSAQEDYRSLMQVLNELRAPMGSLDLEGFLSVVDPAGEAQGEYRSPLGVRVLNAVLQDAMRRGVQDVYIEPDGSKFVLRHRSGRNLNTVVEIPPHVHPSLVGQVKNISQIDAARKNKKLEGTIRFSPATQFKGWAVDVVVAPLEDGERIHLRLHPPEDEEEEG